MSRRFADVAHPRPVATAGERLAGWLAGIVLGLLLSASAIVLLRFLGLL